MATEMVRRQVTRTPIEVATININKVEDGITNYIVTLKVLPKTPEGIEKAIKAELAELDKEITFLKIVEYKDQLVRYFQMSEQEYLEHATEYFPEKKDAKELKTDEEKEGK